MRILNIILCLLMVSFAAVQYNDPDGVQWAIYYLIGAAWSATAAFRRTWLTTNPGRPLLMLSIAIAALGALWYWPSMPAFWQSDVWLNEETAREGMGVMVLLIVMLTAWLSGRKPGLTVKES